MLQTIEYFFQTTVYREWYFFLGGAITAALIFAIVCVCVHAVKKKKRLAKKRKEEMERDRAFTLPDRENEFIKERLKNHLKPQKEGQKEYKFSECVPSFDYTRGILSKLKAAPLSVADRLQTQGISRDVTHFAFQEKLSPEDVRVLNERLSDMIKLSAKYAVIK